MNAPSLCVVVAIFSPVARLSSVTVAPGSTAPLVSRATPTMRPRVVCADAGPAADATMKATNSSRREARAIMDDPPNDDQDLPVLRRGLEPGKADKRRGWDWPWDGTLSIRVEVELADGSRQPGRSQALQLATPGTEAG